MVQQETVGPVENAVGYVLKEAAVALRTAMDAVLRPLQLTVPQYSCLELLGQRPGLSNAELARGTFVTRQSMNVVLQGLEERGLVTRPATAARGR
ncbi:MarR family transcriptional regulator, partial [Actinoplanes sp. NPDC048791]|uniref:MarR family winged helix-turn-helix transcriptional regulator n=1 Tax=Actinoplanes sp. NPDC048791 TaxID=3154623 RepID=UPI003407AFC1